MESLIEVDEVVEVFQSTKIMETTITELDELDDAADILDLCQYIEGSKENGISSGVLREKKSLYTVNLGKGQEIQVATLESLLELQEGSGSCSLSRLQRLYIALRLVVSIQPLHGTPWIGDKWGKQNVLVQFSTGHDRTSPGLQRIYITPTSGAPDGNEANQKADCMKALRCLGIVLLELCFGRRLEDYAGWKEFLGPDGKANAYTSTAAALEWQEKLPGEAGENMAEAVRKCLAFAFETRSRSLEDEDLAIRFHDGVVQPVQEHWRLFFGRPV
jgi:hypothetical protein